MARLFTYVKVFFSVFLISLFLLADNCQSPSRILIQHNELATAQAGYLVYPLAAKGNADAMAALTKLAIDSDAPYWLSLAGDMGSSGALYYLAMRSENSKDIRKWLKSSAEMGHPQSQFEYALLPSSASEKMYWMQKSAVAGYRPAIISMAKYTFESQDNSQATQWLEKAAVFDDLSAFKLANLYWKQDENEKALALFNQGAANDFGPAKTALNTIQSNTTQTLSSLLELAPVGPNCAQTIQFAATTLVSFIQAKSFHAQFEKDKRLADLPICALPPIWLKKDSVQCSSNFDNEARLGCDLYPLSQLQTALSFTHLVIFAEQGKANVNNGLMFLDQTDTYSVFVHELAHFAGFVDEYALPERLANYHCTRNEAPNLLLKGDTEDMTQPYIPIQRADNWKRALEAHNQLQLLENDRPVLHHIARSNTCKNTDFKSFKPSNQLTFLEYHDVPNIPKVYRTLWRQALLNKANYPAINDNLAIAAFANNDNSAGVFWSNQTE